MIEARCDCGELLVSFTEHVQGSMVLICPNCQVSTTWQSTCSLGVPVTWEDLELVEQENEGQSEEPKFVSIENYTFYDNV